MATLLNIAAVIDRRYKQKIEMEQEQFLLAIAQVAVTLAGFSGLVVAIRGESPSQWHARDIWSLSWMFGSSFGALFLALLPLLLHSFRLDEKAIWIGACAVLAIFVIGFSVTMIVWGTRLTTAGYPPRVRFFPKLARMLLMLSGVLAGAAAIGILPEARVGLFALGLIACLVVSALSLVVFLVVLARAAAGRT